MAFKTPMVSKKPPGSPVNLTNTPGTDEGRLSWSSDGSQFAAEVWHPDISDVVVYNFNSDNNPPITRVTSLVRLNDVTALGRPVTQGCDENFECIRINEVSWSKGQPDLVAVATNNRITPEWVDDVWCVEVDDPMDAVNLTNSIPGEEGARDPTWSPDNTQLVALTQLFVQKGNAKVGRYDSSLIKLNLSSNGSGLCPAVLDPVLDVQTILDPDVGEFIGHADWRRGTVCGNYVFERGEQCDDGNNDDGDGCSALCLSEPVSQ